MTVKTNLVPFDKMVETNHSYIVRSIFEYTKENPQLSIDKSNGWRVIFMHLNNHLFVEIAVTDYKLSDGYNISVKLFSGVFMNDFSTPDPFCQPTPVFWGTYRVIDESHCDQNSLIDYASDKEDRTVVEKIDFNRIAREWYERLISLPERKYE